MHSTHLVQIRVPRATLENIQISLKPFTLGAVWEGATGKLLCHIAPSSEAKAHPRIEDRSTTPVRRVQESGSGENVPLLPLPGCTPELALPSGPSMAAGGGLTLPAHTAPAGTARSILGQHRSSQVWLFP